MTYTKTLVVHHTFANVYTNIHCPMSELSMSELVSPRMHASSRTLRTIFTGAPLVTPPAVSLQVHATRPASLSTHVILMGLTGATLRKVSKCIICGSPKHGWSIKYCRDCARLANAMFQIYIKNSHAVTLLLAAATLFVTSVSTPFLFSPNLGVTSGSFDQNISTTNSDFDLRINLHLYCQKQQ